MPVSAALLLQDLERDKPGLVIEKDGRRAVFLPQVWKQVTTAEGFLQQLCLKAGLSPEAWREGMNFQLFRVIH
jgi:AMMECR1 domain-containing protein